MNFEEFLSETQILGKKLKSAKERDELAYLNTLAERIKNLKSIPRVKMENQAPEWMWTLLDYKAPVGSVRMKLKKNGKLPVHDHRGYISLLYVVSGEVKITHYSSDNITPKSKSFELKKDEETYISKGEFSFSTTENNIHAVEDLGEGSVLLDVSTFLKGRGESYEINIEPVSKRKNNKIFTGTWSGVRL